MLFQIEYLYLFCEILLYELFSKPSPSQLTIQLYSDEVELQIGGQAGAEAGEAGLKQALRPKGDFVEVRVSATTVVNHPTPR